jgi:acyl-CoA synthetase (AMP-forming)/AMP-acid ligase II
MPLASREDDRIVRAGFAISPAEIESALLTHPMVRDAAVFGVTDCVLGHRLVAVVQLESESNDAVIDKMLRQECIWPNTKYLICLQQSTLYPAICLGTSIARVWPKLSLVHQPMGTVIENALQSIIVGSVRMRVSADPLPTRQVRRARG